MGRWDWEAASKISEYTVSAREHVVLCGGLGSVECTFVNEGFMPRKFKVIIKLSLTVAGAFDYGGRVRHRL